MAEHSLTCRGCGEQFLYHRRKAHCRPSCRPSSPYAPERCEGCGCGNVDARGFCRACLERQRKIKQAVQARCRDDRDHLPPALKDRKEPPATQVRHTCKVCASAFYPKKAAHTTCCSRECGWVWLGFKQHIEATGGRVIVRVYRRPKAKPKENVGECRVCGIEFARVRAWQRYCSEPCEATHHEKAKAAAKEKCRKSPSRRAYKKRRKAMERGARRADKVDPITVFARDGWRCQMCGAKTPERLRGTTNARAPELDHIVALANGGAHSYQNTQCLCRSCNCKKGATDFGQLHLFAAG